MECIAIGAGILGCGGGGSPSISCTAALSALREGKKITIRNPSKYEYIISCIVGYCYYFLDLNLVNVI